ncbi:MAG: alpha/beta hydrolase [bacterium]|nr:alpha/beta hydrolase [bacterium]
MAHSTSEAPLVFIHDWFTDPTAQWSAQGARFGRDYDCHYFRLAGHGEDPAEFLPEKQPVLDYNLVALQSLIESFQRPARIIAHGAGTLLALRLAALIPDRLTCMVLIAPAFHLDRYRWLARLCARLPFLLPLYLLLVDPVAETQVGAWKRMRTRLRCLRGANAALYLRQGLEEQEPYLAEIRLPVFLIAGDMDPLGGARLAEKLSESLPGSRLLRYGHLGHNPHREEPDLVNSAIEHFLAAHNKRGPLHAIGGWLNRVKKLIVGDGDSN